MYGLNKLGADIQLFVEDIKKNNLEMNEELSGRLIQLTPRIEENLLATINHFHNAYEMYAVDKSKAPKTFSKGVAMLKQIISGKTNLIENIVPFLEIISSQLSRFAENHESAQKLFNFVNMSEKKTDAVRGADIGPRPPKTTLH